MDWIFLSILGSEMGPKCNKIDSKSTRLLLKCCEWCFWVSSWRSRSFLEWSLLFRPSNFIEKHSVFQRFLAWQSIASPKKSHQFFTSQVINKMIKNHLQVNKTLPKISCEKVIDFWLSFYWIFIQIGIKLGPRIHQKWTFAALLELRGGRLRTTWTALALPLRPKCRPWIPSGSQLPPLPPN